MDDALFRLPADVALALSAQVSERTFGSLSGSDGTTCFVDGLAGFAALGDGCTIETASESGRSEKKVFGEVVGFEGQRCTVLAYDRTDGLAAGARVELVNDYGDIRPTLEWRGRVIDAFCQPVDGKGALPQGSASARSLKAAPPPASQRKPLGPRVSLGVDALDLFTPCRNGQRLGLFAGSGVGKSSLLAMIAKRSEADVLVVGLIGERGRELNEFLNEALGQEGRARSVVVVATSDQPPLTRRRAAYATMAVAEHFRDQGLNVVCLIDSVTRFATALREIRLATGEPPASRGYPPGVWSELPQLLERAGPGTGEGNMTAIFTVLVEGGDHDEPVSDAVRGLLDGHVVLDRAIAESGRYPAVDVLASLSRTAPGCYSAEEHATVQEARRVLQIYEEHKDLVAIGAYRGGNAELDRAIRLRPRLEQLLTQPSDAAPSPRPFAALAEALRS